MLKKIGSLGLSGRIVLGSIIGLILGFILKENAGSLAFLGDIFLRSVKMCVPLLIFCSIVEATASLPLHELKNIGFKTLGVFFVTTSLASVLTVLAVKVFPPVLTIAPPATGAYETTIPDTSFAATIVSFIPDNALKALSDGVIVQIIVFAVLFGVSVNILKSEFQEVDRIYGLVLGLRKIVMKIVTIIMYYAPIGISAMLANITGTSGMEALKSLGQVLLIVSILDIIFYLLYTFYLSIRYQLSPIKIVKNSSSVLLMALTTTSSAVSLPVALEDVPKKMGVNAKISNFVLPLGSALNTNGAPITNITCAVACASVFGIELNMNNLIMLGVYAVVASFGNPGVPGGGIVSMAIVFQMIGIPIEGVAIFAGLDYFFSLTRAPLNIIGNVYSSLIVGNKMKEFDKEIFNS